MEEAKTVPLPPNICPIASCLRCLVCSGRWGCDCPELPWNGAKGDASNWVYKIHWRIFTSRESAIAAKQGASWHPLLMDWCKERFHSEFDMAVPEFTLCGTCRASFYKS